MSGLPAPSIVVGFSYLVTTSGTIITAIGTGGVAAVAAAVGSVVITIPKLTTLRPG